MRVRDMGGCVGCPMFQDGSQPFVPDEINAPDGPFAIVAQNPGADEEDMRRPLVGKTGQMMDRTFLPVTGFTRAETNLLNVLKCRWKGGNTLPPAAILKPAVKHCMAAHVRLPATTKVGIAMGGLAWESIVGEGKISAWRGHAVDKDGVRWIASLHLADLFRDTKMHHITVADWRKVKLIQRGEYPRPIPPSSVNDPAWFKRAMEAPYVVIDGEWNPDTRVLHLLGLGHPSVGYTQLTTSAIGNPKYHTLYRDVVGTVPVVFHNAMADLPVVANAFGVGYRDYRAIDDTMLAHAVLWSEWPHTLEFLASVYGQHAKLKHLAGTDMRLYNLGDVLATVDVWEALKGEFAFDPQSEQVYREQSLPLIPVVLKAMYV